MNTVTYLKILNFKAIFQSKYLLICYLILSVSITENYAQQKNSKSTVYSAEQASKMIAEADQITMKEGNNMPSPAWPVSRAPRRRPAPPTSARSAPRCPPGRGRGTCRC